MRLRVPIAEDIFLHNSLMWLDHESRSSIIKPNDVHAQPCKLDGYLIGY